MKSIEKALAVAILITAFVHAVRIQGALDGPLGTPLLYGGMAIAGASILYAGFYTGFLRPLRLRDQERTHWEKPDVEDPAP